MIECETVDVCGNDGGVTSGNKAYADDTRALDMSFLPARVDKGQRRWWDGADGLCRVLKVVDLDVSCRIACRNTRMVVR